VIWSSARTKHGADRVVPRISPSTGPRRRHPRQQIQNARQAALNGFPPGSVRILVATDIAARGIDVQNISHVVNFELPDEPRSYVHRIGRTAATAPRALRSRCAMAPNAASCAMSSG
jgi:ATP-dependent RNA helicase RhlE